MKQNNTPFDDFIIFLEKTLEEARHVSDQTGMKTDAFQEILSRLNKISDDIKKIKDAIV